MLAAADALFDDGDDEARRRRYVEAMARLAGGYPDDPDVVSLYALALLGTTSRSLIGFGDAHDPALAGSALQAQVASLLTGVLARHPEHPGALHYLIHAYDDPQHASLALGAARTYSRVARGASHALHMPAHVFLQLGMWSDAASSDRAAYDASSEWVKRKALPPALRNYHALSWLQYELLQQGRYADARDLIQQLEPVVAASGAARAGHDGTHQPLLSDLSSMRARYVIESRRWEVMAGQTNFGNVNDLFAIGMGAARTGNVRVAQTVRQALADRAASPQEGDLRPAIAIMEREIAALLSLADGRQNEAVSILQAAAQAESSLPAPLGLPAPIKPAPELLGEVLIEIGRPGDAIAPFESVLRLRANRSLSVLGLARAAAASGKTAMARQRYLELLANFRTRGRRSSPSCRKREASSTVRRLRHLHRGVAVVDVGSVGRWRRGFAGGWSAARLAAPGACSQAATGKPPRKREAAASGSPSRLVAERLLEPIPEAQLPDPHEAGLGLIRKAGAVDRVLSTPLNSRCSSG